MTLTTLNIIIVNINDNGGHIVSHEEALSMITSAIEAWPCCVLCYGICPRPNMS